MHDAWSKMEHACMPPPDFFCASLRPAPQVTKAFPRPYGSWLERRTVIFGWFCLFALPNFYEQNRAVSVESYLLSLKHCSMLVLPTEPSPTTTSFTFLIDILPQAPLLTKWPSDHYRQLCFCFLLEICQILESESPESMTPLTNWEWVFPKIVDFTICKFYIIVKLWSLSPRSGHF